MLSAGTALVLVMIRAQQHVCHTAGNEVTAEHSIMLSGLSAVAASTDVQVSHHGESITGQNMMLDDALFTNIHTANNTMLHSLCLVI